MFWREGPLPSQDFVVEALSEVPVMRDGHVPRYIQIIASLSGNRVIVSPWEHHVVVDGYSIKAWPRSQPLPNYPSKPPPPVIEIEPTDIVVLKYRAYWSGKSEGVRPASWQQMLAACMSPEASSVDTLQSLINTHSRDTGIDHFRMYCYRDPATDSTILDWAIAGPFKLARQKVLVVLGSLRIAEARVKKDKTYSGELLNLILRLYPYFCIRVMLCVGALIALDRWGLHLHSESRPGLENVFSRGIDWKYWLTTPPVFLGVLAELEGKHGAERGGNLDIHHDLFFEMPHLRMANFKLAAYTFRFTYSKVTAATEPFSGHNLSDTGLSLVPMTSDYAPGELKQILETACANHAFGIVESVFWRLRTEVSADYVKDGAQVMAHLAKFAPECDKAFFVSQLDQILWRSKCEALGAVLVDSCVLTTEEVKVIVARSPRFSDQQPIPKPVRPVLTYLDWPTGELAAWLSPTHDRSRQPTPSVSPHPEADSIQLANETYAKRFEATLAEQFPTYGTGLNNAPWNTLIGSNKSRQWGNPRRFSNWTRDEDYLAEPLHLVEPPCWEQLTSLLARNDLDWFDHLQEAQVKLGNKFWTVFSHIDKNDCSLFDYAVLAPAGAVSNIGIILSRLCFEKARIDSLILTGSMTKYDSDDEATINLASGHLNDLRNSMPFRAWELIGRHLAIKVYKLHLQPQFILEYPLDNWLDRVSENGELAHFWVGNVSKGTSASFGTKWWGLLSHPQFAYHLIINHVRSAASPNDLKHVLRGARFGDAAPPIFKAISVPQWLDIFEVCFERRYVEFFRFAMARVEGLSPEWLKAKLDQLTSKYDWPETHVKKFKCYIVRYEGRFWHLVEKPSDYPKELLDTTTTAGPAISVATPSLPEPFGIFSEVLEHRPAPPLVAYTRRNIFDDNIAGVNLNAIVTLKLMNKRIRQAEECIAADCCTFTRTGPNFLPAVAYTCSTCAMKDGEAMCLTCKNICHLGHDVSEAKMSSGFYCDCGAMGAKGKFGCRTSRKAIPSIAGLVEVEDPLWINGFQNFQFRSITFAQEMGGATEPECWPRLTQAATDGDLETFKSIIEEYYKAQLAQGSSDAWKIFAYVDHLRIDLMMYALVRIREGVALPREILKRLYMEWRLSEALVACLEAAKASKDRITIAQQKLNHVRGIYVTAMQRFSEYIGTSLLNAWHVEAYTEVGHRVKSWDRDQLTEPGVAFGNIHDVFEQGFASNLYNHEGVRRLMVIPEYLKAACIAQVQMGQTGNFWRYVVRDPDMRSAVDWRSLFNMFMDLFDAAGLVVSVSIHLNALSIDGSAIYGNIDKERIKKFLSENPYDKEVGMMTRTVNARRLLTPAEVAACAEARQQNVKSLGDILSPKRSIDLRDHKERPFGNMTWNEFAEFSKKPVAADEFADAIQASNDELAQTTRHYVQRNVRRIFSDKDASGGPLTVPDELVEQLASSAQQLKAAQRFLALFGYDTEMLNLCYRNQWLYPWHDIPDPSQAVLPPPVLTAPPPLPIHTVLVAPNPTPQTILQLQLTKPQAAPVPAPVSPPVSAAPVPEPSKQAAPPIPPKPQVVVAPQSVVAVSGSAPAAGPPTVPEKSSKSKEKSKSKSKEKTKEKSKEKSKSKEKEKTKEKSKSKDKAKKIK